MDLSALSSVGQDYLKAIWSATEWGDPAITTSGLAARFGTTSANVSDTLRRLQDYGLVVYRPYRPATLTALGQRLAVSMVRRHRLLETYLAEQLGYAADQVHAEAERLEHAVSDHFLAVIDELLAHPTTDPHGDPIPAADGSWVPRPPTLVLSQAEPGDYQVARVSDADPAVLAQLAERGVRPGVWVRVVVRADQVRVRDQPGRLDPAQQAAVRVFQPKMSLGSAGDL